ncbi:MAG TPA: hypothetical protein VLE93_03400 [Candidatus Saccharimonadales bacterium]|nr:hypothetical protein [Candidatus Saccharimonadales bacterium]
MLTKDDLKAIGQLVEFQTAPIVKSIEGLKNDVGDLKTDVVGLKTDVGDLKSDVFGLKTDMKTVKKDVK